MSSNSEDMSRAKVFCGNCGVEIYYSEGSTRWTEANGTGRNVCPAGASAIARHIPETREDREGLIDFVATVLKDEDRTGALTCGTTKATKGWECSRELGHDGPCAASRLKADPVEVVTDCNQLPKKAEGGGVGQVAEELYYVQDKRQYCGNSVFWWKPHGNGYTCNLNEAWKVTRAKAEIMMRHRPDVDVAWPVALIDAGSQRHFDMQDLREIKSL